MNTDALPLKSPEFKSAFSAFIAFYNKMHGTDLRAKDAIEDFKFYTLFQNTRRAVLQVSGTPSSTKARSLSQTDIQGTNLEVLRFLQGCEPKSRNEIAKGLNMRLQTVCGAVNRLVSDGRVRVVGEKVDLETNRSVEIVTAV